MYASGIQSCENSEPIPHKSSAKIVHQEDNLICSNENRFDTIDNVPLVVKCISKVHLTDESKQSNKSGELNTDSPFKDNPEEMFQSNSIIEEHEYILDNDKSDVKNKENKQRRWNSLLENNSPAANRQLLSAKSIQSKNNFDLKGNMRRINESIEKAKSSLKHNSRNFRSIDNYEMHARNDSNDKFDCLGNTVHLKKELRMCPKKQTKWNSKNTKQNSSMFSIITEHSKTASNIQTSVSSQFITHSSNRTIQNRNLKEGLFHEIIRKTSSSLVSPFLKQKRNQEKFTKNDRLEETKQLSKNNMLSVKVLKMDQFPEKFKTLETDQQRKK